MKNRENAFDDHVIRINEPEEEKQISELSSARRFTENSKAS
jgi:hypothetical protein